MPLPTTEQGSFGTPRKPRRPRLPSAPTSSSSAGVNPYAAKQSFPDQTIQQVQVRPPVTTSYRPTQFESQFKTFMESFAPSIQGDSPVGPEPISAGATDPTDLMPEMVKEYEGRLFSKRFNSYLMEQALGRGSGASPKTQEEAAKKFFMGLSDITTPIEGIDLASQTSDYGPRIHPIRGDSSFHTGIDLSSPSGTPIRAVANGRVSEANAGDPAYGNQIILTHGRDKDTMYGHMEKFIVQPGQRVKKGQIIGYVGSTGLSTGPHLHLETWDMGKPVSPMNFLQNVSGAPTFKGPEYTGPPLIGAGQGDATSGPSVPAYSANPPAPVGLPNGMPVWAEPSIMPMQANPNSVMAPTVGGDLGAFLQAISTQESGGNYGAVGVQTDSGTALGKYQILDSNIAGPGGWDQETIGREITPQEFLSNPQLQEAIARAKLTNYFKQYGPAGAAKAWYAGPGNAFSNSDSAQYGGPSINDYAASVIAHMRKYQ